MTDEIETANAEADKNSVDNNNISVEDFAMRRLGELNPAAEEPQEKVTEETEEPEVEGNVGCLVLTHFGFPSCSCSKRILVSLELAIRSAWGAGNVEC